MILYTCGIRSGIKSRMVGGNKRWNNLIMGLVEQKREQ